MFRIISVFSLFLGLTCTSCSDDSDLNGGMAPDNGSENSANSSLLEGIEKYANLPIEDNGKATFGAFMYKATDVTVKMILIIPVIILIQSCPDFIPTRVSVEWEKIII